MGEISIPTIDLHEFNKSEDGRNKAVVGMRQACSDYGFFQVVNHGVPVGLMSRALEVSDAFFALPPQEKLKCTPPADAPLPAGYKARDLTALQEKNETFMVLPPHSTFNVYPHTPHQFKETVREVFSHLSKLSWIVENMLNDCLGLPPNFLSDSYHDKSSDFMVVHHYSPATETHHVGLTEHEDMGLVTFVFQDDAGGLQVCSRDGTWIPVVPTKGAIIVNIGDVIQVLSNNKFKSATHKVVRPRGRSRSSYAFFCNPHGDKWVGPLPEFTQETGDSPKYEGFLFKEYKKLRTRNKAHPPLKLQDMVRITHYAIKH